VPDELAAVVARALAKDPADRYPDGGALARALQSARIETRELAGVGGPPAPTLASPSPPAPATPGQPLGPEPEPTRAAPRLGRRTNVNPSARRRTAALLGLAGAVLGALVVAAVLTTDHHGGGGAAHRVEVPLVVNESLADARARLHARHLRVTARTVPAPGIRPGTVTGQRPIAGHATPARSVVHLSVAEVPRFRTVTMLAAPTTTSVYFRIRGARWRILSTVSSSRHCALLFVDCRGTSATLLRRDGSTVTSVGLGDGEAQPQGFTTGPGVYRLRVDPASGDTRWSITIQDDY
jgi:hypothetical protein